MGVPLSTFSRSSNALAEHGEVARALLPRSAEEKADARTGSPEDLTRGHDARQVLSMKRIEAVIRPHQLDPVKERLASAGVHGLTVVEVRGFGRQKGHTERYRGAEYVVDLLPKLQLTVVASEEQVAGIVQALIDGARTGTIGDGKIFVTPLDDVIRIRTGEHGRDAI